jgi:uncharacterized protein (DUF433 family)
MTRRDEQAVERWLRDQVVRAYDALKAEPSRAVSAQDVRARAELYQRGLERIDRDDEILGGEPVFKGTRLAVRHIGGMRANGQSVEQIREDYPELSSDDIEFARLYAEAPPFAR